MSSAFVRDTPAPLRQSKPAAGRKINRALIIVGGGVAAYKALELVRLLRNASLAVTPVLTRAGAKFVTPLALAALAGEETRQDLFSTAEEARMGHIALTRAADLVIVAPATADLMAKAAAGLADDLASTALLATRTSILMAPAMNVAMWEHPATRRNRERLAADGVRFIGPEEGEMACGETGAGRMAEPPAILAAALALIEEARQAGARPLAGRHVLVTAGPTAEPIDPVRVLTNRSSGRQGYAVAAACAALGARVSLISGPTALEAPRGVDRIDVQTACEMLAACRSALPADAAVCLAAVSDWRPRSVARGKIKKVAGGPPNLRLVENPDILAALAAAGPKRPRLVVGFAAETDDLEANALAKLEAKGCDLILANDVADGAVFGGAENEVLLISPGGARERWPRAGKAAIAQRLARRIAEALA